MIYIYIYIYICIYIYVYLSIYIYSYRPRHRETLVTIPIYYGSYYEDPKMAPQIFGKPHLDSRRCADVCTEISQLVQGLRPGSGVSFLRLPALMGFVCCAKLS